jgi:hypothetical protein
MKRQLPIAAVAGMAASFALPVPRNEKPVSAAPKVSAASHPSARRASPAPSKDWPLEMKSIAGLSANGCGEALDKILRYHACTLPEEETLNAAVALTMRLVELSAASSPLAGRRLPAWLLGHVTASYLQQSFGLPAAWMNAVAVSQAGRDVIAALTAEFAVSFPDKAKALAAAAPDRWRPDLNRKVREGLAVHDPLAAARESWEAASPTPRDPSLSGPAKYYALAEEHYFRGRNKKDDDRLSVLTVSSLKGPVKETVEAITLYGEGGANESELRSLFTNLLRRDAAATQAAVDATGDPLTRALFESAKKPSSPNNRLRLPVESGGWDQSPRVDTSAVFQMHDPDGAARLEVATQGSVPAQLMREGFTDPAQAFDWAKTNQPGHLQSIFRLWVQSDGPAALKAALSLPQSDSFRRMVETSMTLPNLDEVEWRNTLWARESTKDPLSDDTSQEFAPRPFMAPEICTAARYVKILEPAPAATPAPSAPPASSSSRIPATSSLWKD